MTFDWNDYLRLAEDLYDSPQTSEEASYRTAISRAYYSAFHLAAQTLESQRTWRRAHTALDHKDLRDFLQRFHSQPKGKAGADLGRLYVLRVRADYEDEMTNPKADAQQSLRLAKGIVSLLPRF